MKSVRLWSVRHAHGLSSLYDLFMRFIPYLRRVITWIGRGRAERWLVPAERTIKEFFFDCKMCGRCSLSSTGMACPMNCPKRHRNGPCGGVGADGSCEVDPGMRCVWLEAADGSRRMGSGAKFADVQPPVDANLQGSSAWIRTIMDETVNGTVKETKAPQAAPVAAEVSPAPDRKPGALETACRSGRFVVTAELSPPDSADPQDLLRRTAVFRGIVDAVNVTDSAGAHCHMSSLAASALLIADGYEPVFQMACRDRNRIAMQGDILGAAALGVRNLLAITGDGVGSGDHPNARPVFDLDSVSLLQIARGLRDRGEFASGRKVTKRPDLFFGATINPFAPPFEERMTNFEKKIAAGAQFVQTQYCFDVPVFESFMRRARARGLDRLCHIIVGVGPLPSARTARWMVAHVPGVSIPEAILSRLEGAQDQKREGIRICIETIQALRAMEGVAGVHLMAHRNESLVPGILQEAGLMTERNTAVMQHGVA